MSNPRGRRDGMPFPRPYGQSWPNQPPNYFANDFSHHPGWGDDVTWNRPQGFGWESGSQSNSMVPRPPWPRQYFLSRGHHNMNEPSPPFDQCQPRFSSGPFHMQNGPRFPDRSLVHLGQSPLDESATSSRGGRDGLKTKSLSLKPPCGSSSKHVSLAKQDGNQKIADMNSTSNIKKTLENQSTVKGSGNISSSPSVSKSAEKSPASTIKPSSFMPPNDDLRNMVKESLKALSKNGSSPAPSTPAATDPSMSSPARKVREARIPSGDRLTMRRSSGENPVRRVSGEYCGSLLNYSPSSSNPVSARTPTSNRRRVNSQSSSASEPNTSSLLDGLGYIQRIPNDANPSVHNQAVEEASQGEPVTISKEQLNRYIKSMDNHQRRQLVEQPKDRISKHLLDHLVQENQTARARQLSSLRFRVSSNDIEITSRTESHVVLSEELVEQIKELLSQQDVDEPNCNFISLPQPDKSRSSKLDDDEIEILDPPPKEPPVCIDLDCDELPLPRALPTTDNVNTSTLKPAGNQKSSVDNINLVTDLTDQTDEVTSQVVDSASSFNTQTAVQQTSVSHLVESCNALPAVVSPEVTTLSNDVNPSNIDKQSSDPRFETRVPATEVNASLPSIVGDLSLAQTSSSEQTEREENSEKLVSCSSTNDTSITAGSLVDTPREPQHTNSTTSCEKNLDSTTEEPRTKTIHGDNTNIALRNSGVGTNSHEDACMNDDLNMNVSPNTCSMKDNSASVDLNTANSKDLHLPIATNERAIELHQPSFTALNSQLHNLKTAEQNEIKRMAEIDQMILDLQTERKNITERLLSIKQRQFDIVCSSLPSEQFMLLNIPFARDNLPSHITTTPQPVQNEFIDPKAPSGMEPCKSIVPSSSNKNSQLLDLAQLLEQNGVQVALRGKDVSTKSAPSNSSSTSKKRKRTKTQQGETEVPKKNDLKSKDSAKGKASSSTSATKSKSKSASASASTQSPASAEPSSAKRKRKNSNLQLWDVSTSPSNETVLKDSEKREREGSKTQKPKASSSSRKNNEAGLEVTHATLGLSDVQSKGNQLKAASPELNPPSSSLCSSSLSQPISKALPSEPELTLRLSEPSSTMTDKSRTHFTDTCVSKQIEPGNISVVSSPSKSVKESRPLPNTSCASRSTASVDQTNNVPLPGIGERAGDNISKTTNALFSPTSPVCAATGFLEPHTTKVQTMFINGPCLFTASDDGTVHVYDLVSGLLSMRILGHQDPVTFLYAVSLKKTAQQLKDLPNTAEYLNNLNLITGSKDGYVRQFSLETGNLLHETDSRVAVTCSAANKRQHKLYVGTKSGMIFSFDPKTNDLRPVGFKVSGEILCMKATTIKIKRVLIVSAVNKNLAVYDCASEERLMSLSTGVPNTSIRCISACGQYIFCCCSNKTVYTFDLTNDKPLVRVDNLTSRVVSCFHHNSKYLFLACEDGTIRVFDTQKKSGSALTLSGPHPKTISCMKFSDSKIICGTLSGEIFFRAIPRFASGK